MRRSSAAVTWPLWTWQTAPPPSASRSECGCYVGHPSPAGRRRCDRSTALGTQDPVSSSASNRSARRDCTGPATGARRAEGAPREQAGGGLTPGQAWSVGSAQQARTPPGQEAPRVPGDGHGLTPRAEFSCPGDRSQAPSRSSRLRAEKLRWRTGVAGVSPVSHGDQAPARRQPACQPPRPRDGGALAPGRGLASATMGALVPPDAPRTAPRARPALPGSPVCRGPQRGGTLATLLRLRTWEGAGLASSVAFPAPRGSDAQVALCSTSRVLPQLSLWEGLVPTGLRLYPWNRQFRPAAGRWVHRALGAPGWLPPCSKGGWTSARGLQVDGRRMPRVHGAGEVMSEPFPLGDLQAGAEPQAPPRPGQSGTEGVSCWDRYDGPQGSQGLVPPLLREAP